MFRKRVKEETTVHEEKWVKLKVSYKIVFVSRGNEIKELIIEDTKIELPKKYCINDIINEIFERNSYGAILHGDTRYYTRDLNEITVISHEIIGEFTRVSHSTRFIY